MLAVVRVRGPVSVSREVSDTLRMLKLSRVNHCVIARKSPSIDGMLFKAKDYVTWGEVSKEMLEKLVLKRGRAGGAKKLEAKAAKEVARKILEKGKADGVKPVFRLSPPSKGYKSVKSAFPKGALGYRGDKINELLERML